MRKKVSEKKFKASAPKVIVTPKKMNEMQIKASVNLCCTWQHIS